MSDSSERQVAFLGSIGFIAVLVISYAVVFGAGWLGHSFYAGQSPGPFVPPAPPYNPYTPRPEPWDTWYTPPRAALRQLPTDPSDGYDRRGQTWRWEINQRAEYRFRKVAGDEQPLGDAPQNVGRAAASTKVAKPDKPTEPK